MNCLQEALDRMGKPEFTVEDACVLDTLARGADLFCQRMQQFQDRWAQGDYTEEEQRHVARMTCAYVKLQQALSGRIEDNPFLWLGVLALGKFTRPGDVFLPPPGFEMVRIHPGSDQNPLNKG